MSEHLSNNFPYNASSFKALLQSSYNARSREEWGEMCTLLYELPNEVTQTSVWQIAEVMTRFMGTMILDINNQLGVQQLEGVFETKEQLQVLVDNTSQSRPDIVTELVEIHNSFIASRLARLKVAENQYAEVETWMITLDKVD